MWRDCGVSEKIFGYSVSVGAVTSPHRRRVLDHLAGSHLRIGVMM